MKIMGQPHRKTCKLNFQWKICGNFFQGPPLQGSKILRAPFCISPTLTSVCEQSLKFIIFLSGRVGAKDNGALRGRGARNLASQDSNSMATFDPKSCHCFKALELNIFKLLAKPSCYIEELNMNIYREFFIGLSFISLVVFLPSIVYACKFAYIRIRLLRYQGLTTFRFSTAVTSNLTNTREKCYFFILSMLFISYFSMCDVILSLMPEACKRFCIDENEEICVYHLRSDYSIDCETKEHGNFTKGAYVALTYVIGFPVCVLVVLKRNVNKKNIHDRNMALCRDKSENSIDISHDETQTTDVSDGNNDDENDDIERTCDDDLQRQPRDETQPRNVNLNDINELSNENEMPIPDIEGTNSENAADWSMQYPLYIRFLIGSYKKIYFYWEIVELCRKVLQTVLVVLYGTQDPLTLAATIALSMAFIAIHAYCRPMKNPFEQWLQMISLVAIFLNLLTAVELMVPYNDTSGKRETAMAVFIVGLNISVVLLAVGKNAFLITIKDYITHKNIPVSLLVNTISRDIKYYAYIPNI